MKANQPNAADPDRRCAMSQTGTAEVNRDVSEQAVNASLEL